MKCMRCGVLNPEASKFCNACGTPLDIDGLVKAEVQTQIQEELKTRLKDNKVAAIEIQDQVRDRLLWWLKVVGLPVTLALSLLGWLGYGKYEDIAKKVLRCFTWVVTCSSGQLEVELASEQVDHGLEVAA